MELADYPTKQKIAAPTMADGMRRFLLSRHCNRGIPPGPLVAYLQLSTHLGWGGFLKRGEAQGKFFHNRVADAV